MTDSQAYRAKDKGVLEAAYNANPKPDKPARLEIVSRVSLNEKEVQVSSTTLPSTQEGILLPIHLPDASLPQSRDFSPTQWPTANVSLDMVSEPTTERPTKVASFVPARDSCPEIREHANHFVRPSNALPLIDQLGRRLDITKPEHPLAGPSPYVAKPPGPYRCQSEGGFKQRRPCKRGRLPTPGDG